MNPYLIEAIKIIGNKKKFGDVDCKAIDILCSVSVARDISRIAEAQERLAGSLHDVNLKKSLDEIEYTLKHR
jgi:hypothetical protein